MFWSSQSPKVLRGLNLFCDFEAKTLGGPKRLKRFNLFEVLGDCIPNQKDCGLSALWDCGSCKTLRGPNLLESWTSTRLRPLSVLELSESQSAERPQSF